MATVPKYLFLLAVERGLRRVGGFRSGWTGSKTQKIRRQDASFYRPGCLILLRLWSLASLSLSLVILGQDMYDHLSKKQQKIRDALFFCFLFCLLRCYYVEVHAGGIRRTNRKPLAAFFSLSSSPSLLLLAVFGVFYPLPRLFFVLCLFFLYIFWPFWTALRC